MASIIVGKGPTVENGSNDHITDLGMFLNVMGSGAIVLLAIVWVEKVIVI
jgi:hypothetical protein